MVHMQRYLYWGAIAQLQQMESGKIRNKLVGPWYQFFFFFGAISIEFKNDALQLCIHV